MEPDERLMVGFLELDLQADAHVIYCQRLCDGRFGVGLRFTNISKWLKEPLGKADKSPDWREAAGY
jgi:hypothetical protein